MSLSVLFIGTANGATLRALPVGLPNLSCEPSQVLEAARGLREQTLLVVESRVHVPASTFAAAGTIDARGGLVGGCAIEAGMLRFGSVFSPVPFGPYDVDPFALVDMTGGAQRERPAPEAIDAIVPGLFVVDREAFVELGGLDFELGMLWRAYDLSVRFRNAGKSLRWDGGLTFSVESSLTAPSEMADQREFMQRWSDRLSVRFDLDMPARGAVRRTQRLPMGQRETIAIALPPVEIVLYGEGPLAAPAVRASTRVKLSAVRDGRSSPSDALAIVREILLARSDRYVVLLRADAQLEDGWLERMIIETESAANICGASRPGIALMLLSRIPLDVQPPSDALDVDHAIATVWEQAQHRSRIVRGLARHSVKPSRHASISVVLVAQSKSEFGKTSFEGTYAGDLGVDYFAVATPARPKMVDFLKSYPTIDLIIDDSKSMGSGLNTALARATGEIIVVIGDEFFPPRDWITMVRESFAVRPETGILGFSAVAIEGPQAVDTGYTDIKAFHAYAGHRRATMRREAQLAPRLSALAFAIDARALRAVGGFDERLGGGRWGIEDLTLRIRAAGYEAYVSADIFAHRFPPLESHPYLNETAEESVRAAIFAEKWGLPGNDLAGFSPTQLIARGFDPARDFIPIRDLQVQPAELRERYDAVFVAACSDDRDLDAVATGLRRYFQAFSAADDVLFAVGVGDGLDVETVSARVRAIARKHSVALEAAPDVVISPLGEQPQRWIDTLAAGSRHCVHGEETLSLTRMDDLSPSGFRRARETVLT